MVRTKKTKIPTKITIAMMRKRLYSAVVADALDALGLKQQSPRIPLQARTGVASLIGRCKTMLWQDCKEQDSKPYELELKTVDSCNDDDIVIAAGADSMISGIWGELLSTAAHNRGCVGAIIDGAVRDVTKMTQMGFGVFSRGMCVYDSQHRQRVVAMDVPVEIGGVLFSPGDLVIADADGVVVVPQQMEEEAITRAWTKVVAENVSRDAIKAGMSATRAYEKYGVL